MPTSTDLHSNLINPHLSGLDESDTLAINELSKELIAQGKTVYRFGLGQSSFPVPDNVVDTLRLNAPQKDYLPVKGLSSLREAVADFHRRKDGINGQAQFVLIGPDSKPAICSIVIPSGTMTAPASSGVHLSD